MEKYMYEFSIPASSNSDFIKNIIKLNNMFFLSKIKTFYFALPYNATDRTSFEQFHVELLMIT